MQDQHTAETFGPVSVDPDLAADIDTLAAEQDPHGTDAHAPGAKLDAGKLRAGLVLDDFALALAAVTAVGTVGAHKYTPHGWLSVPDALARYTDAQRRHELAHACGEEHDQDTELPHLAHAAWNALARLQLLLSNSHWCHHELQATTRNTIANMRQQAEQEQNLEAVTAASAAAGLYDEEHKL